MLTLSVAAGRRARPPLTIIRNTTTMDAPVSGAQLPQSEAEAVRVLEHIRARFPFLMPAPPAPAHTTPLLLPASVPAGCGAVPHATDVDMVAPSDNSKGVPFTHKEGHPVTVSGEKRKREAVASSSVHARAADDVTASATAASTTATTNNTGYFLGVKPVTTPRSRGFVMDKWRMRHVAFHIAYLGHDLHGFASQEGDGVTTLDRTNTSSSTYEPPHKRVRVESETAAAPVAHTAPAGSRPASHISQHLTVPTVESAVFAALLQACLISSREECGYSRCGRTDKGVSAAGQILAMRVRSKAKRSGGVDTRVDTVDPHTWVREGGVCNEGEPFPAPPEELDYAFILNNLLPPDIRVLGWADAKEDFSARFSATMRTYRYYFPRRNLNVVAMQEAADLMRGVHDFRNFCKFDLGNTQNFVREVLSMRIVAADSPQAARDATPGISNRPLPSPHSCDPSIKDATQELDMGVDTTGAGAGAISTHLSAGSTGKPISHRCEMLYLEVVGRAFLWHQIRCVAAVLLSVGRGLESPSVVSHLLDVKSHPARPQYNLADEHPLVLFHCGFGEEGFSYPIRGDSEVITDADGTTFDRPVRFHPDPTLYSRMFHSPQALRRLHTELEGRWSKLAVKAAVIRSFCDRVESLPVSVQPASASASETASDAPAVQASPPLQQRWIDFQGDAYLAALTDCEYPVRGGEYEPLLVRPTGLTLEVRWSRLRDEEKAKIAAQHPTNTAKMMKELRSLTQAASSISDSDGAVVAAAVMAHNS